MDLTPEQTFPGTHLSPPDPQPEAPPPLSTAHWIFDGPFGLRAGWSLLIYLPIVFLLGFGLRTIHYKLHPRHQPAAVTASSKLAVPQASAESKPEKPEPMLALIDQEAIVFTLAFLLSCLMAFIERRRVSAFGLGGGNWLSRFLVGAVWGLLAMALLIATLDSAHLLTFDNRLLHGRSILFWGAAQLFGFFLVGLFEEYLFRGYIQFTLTRGMVSIGNLISRPHARAIAFWIAAVITSAIFFIAHTANGGEDKLGLFQVFLAGILFVVALWRTGSLWWGIGFHMAWDWSQSFLYGVPDSGGLMQGRLFATHPVGNPLYSGGTVGPEGSVLCIPIILLILVVLFFTHPSPQPPLELPSQALPPGSLPPQPITLFSDPSSTTA